MTTPLLDAHAAAATLGISVKTLRRHLAAGRVKAIDVGTGHKRGTWRYHPADLETFRTRCATSEAAPCRSTSEKVRPSGNTNSSSTVVDIAEALKRATSGQPAPSNGKNGPRLLLPFKPPQKPNGRR